MPERLMTKTCFLAFHLAPLLLTSCLGQSGFQTSSSSTPSQPSENNKVRVTLHVGGAGAINALDGTTCQNSSVIELENGAETEFQADWDSSNGLQLASFNGCDLIDGGGTICHLTPTADATVSAVFSLAPVAGTYFSDQGTILYISMFDANQDALTFDSDGSIANIALTASNGGTIVCALGGDPAQVSAASNCLNDPNYLFVLDNIDPALAILNIDISVTDDSGLTSQITEPIR